MASMGSVTAEEAEQAAEKLPKFPKIAADNRYGGQRGHMLSMVRKELVRLGFSDNEIDGGGLRVTTTFTKKHMDAAEQGVLEARPDGFSDEELHVGVALVEPGTGALRGFYGGQDYIQSQLNWAVEGAQSGSIFKPIALAESPLAGSNRLGLLSTEASTAA
jgi:membrane peptidoglycan carboxypeptidase